MIQARTNPEIFPNEPEGVMIPPSVQFPVKVARSESERNSSAMRLTTALTEEFNSIQSYVILKNAEAIIEISLDVLREAALKNLQEKEETILGCKVNQKRSAKYEYSHPRLKEIEEEIKKLKDEEKRLKALTESMTEPMAYGSSGEMIEPAKKIKEGLQLAVTLPK